MNRFPFTASQWQELEHQALIFKYIVSSIPVPSDLLFPLLRTTTTTTCGDSSPLSSKFLSPQSQQHAAWRCFQMGMGMGKKIDPEPGRCRRTDGKKWRCAKEAYPDSKYCERHMHRGKNRSRKHVEVLPTPTPNPTGNNIISATSLKTAATLYSLNPAAIAPQSATTNPSCYNYFLDSQDFRRDRYSYGLKDGVDEHAFFCEPSGAVRSFSASSMEDSWPLTMTSSSSSTQTDYSYLQLQSGLGDGKKQNPHFHFHGMPALVKNERGDQEPNKTTTHRFFDEEPIRSRDWDDTKYSNSSTTRLSISIPSSTSDDYFPLFNSRRKNDG